MTPQTRQAGALQGLRRALASAMAALVAVFPSLEPVAMRIGRAGAKRSRLFAGLYWFAQESMLARLRRHGERIRPVQVSGHRLQLDITDRTGRMPYFYRTPYEPSVTDAIVTALRPGDVFVDVGANIGYFTVLAARVVGPTGRVVAFEPHPGARETLATMVQRNGVAGQVEIVPIALSDADGQATLFVQDATTAHSTIEPSLAPMRHVAAFQPATVVPMTTLDAWMAAHPEVRRKVRCIKIDVEGAEPRVVAGMGQLLQSPTLTVLCETTIGGAADTTLTRAGFERHRIEEGAGPYGNFLYVRP